MQDDPTVPNYSMLYKSNTKKDARPIINVQASEEYLIDFALRYIDRIIF